VEEAGWAMLGGQPKGGAGPARTRLQSGCGSVALAAGLKGPAQACVLAERPLEPVALVEGVPQALVLGLNRAAVVSDARAIVNIVAEAAPALRLGVRNVATAVPAHRLGAVVRPVHWPAAAVRAGADAPARRVGSGPDSDAGAVGVCRRCDCDQCQDEQDCHGGARNVSKTGHDAPPV